MPGEISLLFIELGLVIVGLAVAARVSSGLGFSTIPLYLLAGLAFGKGGLAQLPLSQAFIHVGAEIGVLPLLFIAGTGAHGRRIETSIADRFAGGSDGFLDEFSAGGDRGAPAGMDAARGSSIGWRHLHFFVRSNREDFG